METELKSAHISGKYLVVSVIAGAIVGSLTTCATSYWTQQKAPVTQPLVSELVELRQRVCDKGDEIDTAGNNLGTLNLPQSLKDEVAAFRITVFNPKDHEVRLRHGTFTTKTSSLRWYMSQQMSSFAQNDHSDHVKVSIEPNADVLPTSFPLNISVPAKQSRQFSLWFRAQPPEMPSPVTKNETTLSFKEFGWVRQIVGGLEISYDDGIIPGGNLTIVAHSDDRNPNVIDALSMQDDAVNE